VYELDVLQEMKYPKEYSLGDEPQEVRVGDLIWWNEGVCVGFVEEVMEERSDYESWGLDEPSIALTNLHPFAANESKHKQHIGFVTSGGTFVIALEDLEDEGIGLLSDHERSELDWAITEARSKVAPGHREMPICISAVMDMDRREEDWHFHFVDTECKIIETVVFPFRPNTRTQGEQAAPRNR
jgi:hypothetical protein